MYAAFIKVIAIRNTFIYLKGTDRIYTATNLLFQKLFHNSVIIDICNVCTPIVQPSQNIDLIEKRVMVNNKLLLQRSKPRA